MELPVKFVERMLRELGAEEAEALCQALGSEPSTSVRQNPFKKMTQRWNEWGARQIAWSSCGYMLAERPSFTLDTAFHAGA